MRASEPGETAIGLPWLPPSSGSLVALARDASPLVWPIIRTDPAAVLLLARHLPADGPASFPNSVFQSPAVLETAQQRLTVAPTDRAHPDTQTVCRSGIAFALLAERLAHHVGGVDPACAWAGGLLAPLGWYAICAVEPEAAGECLRHREPTLAIQRQHWRFDSQEIGRRLARRWCLPGWLRAVGGHLGGTAAEAGTDDRLFHVVQLAVLLAQANGHSLGFAVGADCDALMAALGIVADDARRLGSAWRDDCEDTSLPADDCQDALLPTLLAVAAEKRRVDDGPFAERLEAELDRFQQALARQRADEALRLQGLKLRALAEFAAGAGHEINNPLAVISGHSQYLLAKDDDDGRRDSLRAIVRQTERIHQILSELMQFARPPQPRRQRLDARTLIAEVLAGYRPLAESRGVQCELTTTEEACQVVADPAMLKTAAGCLIRNAIEAAPKDGWVRVRLDDTASGWQLAVEDSGPGPQPVQCEHLFDPFYSGRHAGRGRGLGLSTAWRFAHEHGGDVRFEPLPDRPARFVLLLPRLTTHPDSNADDPRERLSA
ncbi:MAG: ATP-binding protein [Gemmataceae bacterium]